MDQVLLKLIAVTLDVIVCSDRCMGCHMNQFGMVHIQYGTVVHISGNYYWNNI